MYNIVYGYTSFHNIEPGLFEPSPSRDRIINIYYDRIDKGKIRNELYAKRTSGIVHMLLFKAHY